MTSSAILEKRTSESILYDINCIPLLDAVETISSVASIASDQVGLVFGAPAVNVVAIAYDDGTTAAIGKVIQVRISAGAIPVGHSEQIYIILAIFLTNSGNTREATVRLSVIDEAV